MKSRTILARPQLTSMGIMKSPGTGSMILSMYDPLFEGQKRIGYVGAGTYLYHEDEDLLNTENTESAHRPIPYLAAFFTRSMQHAPGQSGPASLPLYSRQGRELFP